MEFRHLELLRDLAELGSITAVAEAGYRTPSAVSQQVKTMQREIGTALVERVGRGVRLTPAGETLARAGADVSAAMTRAEAVWDEFQGRPTGIVDVTAFPSGGQMLYPRMFARTDLIADISVRCHDQDAATEDMAGLTATHDVVIAHYVFGPPPWTGLGLHAVPLLREPLDIAMSPGHRLAGAPTLTAGDLVGERWIGVPEGYPFDRVLHQISERAGVPTVVWQRFADMQIARELTAAGHGICLMPRYTSTAARAGAHGELVLKPLAGTQAARHIVALARPDRAERLAVRMVIDALAAAARAIG